LTATLVVVRLLTPARPLPTEQEVAAWIRERRNQGRWGKDDQRGAMNLVTPAKRANIKAGISHGASGNVSSAMEKKVERGPRHPGAQKELVERSPKHQREVGGYPGSRLRCGHLRPVVPWSLTSRFSGRARLDRTPGAMVGVVESGCDA
jgi:hypothetical protein